MKKTEANRVREIMDGLGFKFSYWSIDSDNDKHNFIAFLFKDTLFIWKFSMTDYENLRNVTEMIYKFGQQYKIDQITKISNFF